MKKERREEGTRRIYGSSTGIKENDERPRAEQTRDATEGEKKKRAKEDEEEVEGKEVLRRKGMDKEK